MRLFLICFLLIFSAVVIGDVHAERFYQKYSTWYEKIPSNPAIYPNSANYVTALYSAGNFVGKQSHEWGLPIFQAVGDEGIITVNITTTNLTLKNYIIAQGWNKVPIPSGAVPAGNASACGGAYRDGHMTVISADGLSAWDFYKARNCSGNIWSAQTVRKWNLTGDGINSPYDGYGKQRVVSVPLLHGVVTYEEVASGIINHAMEFTSPTFLSGNTSPNYPVYPSAGVGGAGYYLQGSYTVQPGMRFQLNPAFNCNTVIDNFEKMVCVALQTYGMIFVDSAGGNMNQTGIVMEDLTYHTEKWSDIGVDNPGGTPEGMGYNSHIFTQIPLNQLRLIQPLTPPFAGQTSVTPSVNSTPVAVMRVNSISGYTVSITDVSTDDATFPTNAITVNWGDGAISTGNNRATFSHTYTTAATFIITLTARDAGGLYDDSVPQNVTVPQNVSTAPVAVMNVNSIAGYTVSITDASTDNAGFLTNAITVNWGDGATNTGNNRATFSHTYAATGTFKITLTAKDSGGLTSSVVQYVAVPQYVNAAPVAAMTVNSITGYTVSITDASTDNAAFPTNAITVKWGDGAISTGNNRATFSHTYATAGTFNVILTAKDAADLYDSVFQEVSVQQSNSITVKLSPALSTSATFILKQNGITRATGSGTTSYVFTNLNSSPYEILMYKSGYTFDGDAVTAGSQNPVSKTSGSNITVTFTHTP